MILVILLTFIASYQSLGFDTEYTAASITSQQITCMKNYNYTYFVSTEFYGSSRQTTFYKFSNEAKTAATIGFNHIDLLIYIVETNNPEQDSTNLMNFLVNNQVPFNFLWVAPSFTAYINITWNQYYTRYITNLGNWSHLLKKYNTQISSTSWIGVVANPNAWYMVGNSSFFNQYPLAYKGDYTTTFGDFVPIFGWTKPALKITNLTSYYVCNFTSTLIVY